MVDLTLEAFDQQRPSRRGNPLWSGMLVMGQHAPVSTGQAPALTNFGDSDISMFTLFDAERPNSTW